MRNRTELLARIVIALLLGSLAVYARPSNLIVNPRFESVTLTAQGSDALRVEGSNPPTAPLLDDFSLTQVPEPNSILLLGGAALGVMLLRRLRRAYTKL